MKMFFSVALCVTPFFIFSMDEKKSVNPSSYSSMSPSQGTLQKIQEVEKMRKKPAAIARVQRESFGTSAFMNSNNRFRVEENITRSTFKRSEDIQ